MKKRGTLRRKKRSQGWEPTLWLLVLAGVLLIGYFVLAAHGPVVIHLW
jgi:hypothetical protein